MKLAASVTVVALVLASVATAGQKQPLKAEAAAQFKPGVSTLQDVEAVLGRPQSVNTLSNGSVTIVYVSVHARPKAMTFVPIVGLFAGGATGQTSTLAFRFGPDGRLLASSSTEAQVDCKLRLVATSCDGGAFVPASSPMAPAQPVPEAAAASEAAPQPASQVAPPMAGPAPAPVAAPIPTPVAKKQCVAVPQSGGAAVKIVPC